MTYDRDIAEKHWRISEELTLLNTGAKTAMGAPSPRRVMGCRQQLHEKSRLALQPTTQPQRQSLPETYPVQQSPPQRGRYLNDQFKELREHRPGRNRQRYRS